MRNECVIAVVFVAGFAAGCGGGKSGSTLSTGSSGRTGNNVLSIAVDGGPTANQANGVIYENAAFASATVCSPRSASDCVTIDHLLVDTGSTGLRVFQPEVSMLNLPAVNASNGSAAFNCVSFVDGTFMWGAVEQANVTMGSETADSVPIQVISSTNSGVPTSCSNGGTTNDNTAALLGANGILGVGLEPTDCFYAGKSVCDSSFGLSTPPTPAYYTCSGGTCNPAFVNVAHQVANPVALLPKDNNGVIIELPAVAGTARTVSGSLIFGIGTESNNQLSSTATIFTLSCNDFVTVLDGQTLGITNANNCTGPGSFIDSGSNGLFFPNVPNFPQCPTNTPVGDLSGFYCPATTQTLSATNRGQNGKSKNTSFTVANAEDLFTNSSTSTDAAMSGLAGTNPTGVGFDWGLPFFFGVNVYNAIDSKAVPSGAPAAPWWAY